MPAQPSSARPSDPSGLGAVLEAADRALRSWEPVWTGFLDGALRSEAEARLATLSDLRVERVGGHPAAERCRLLLQRSEAALPAGDLAGDFAGLEIAGNFLFDPAEPADFRAGLLASGAGESELGDVWVRGDRGAQAVLASDLARRLDGGTGQVRTVPVRFEARALSGLQLPAPRARRSLSTVEASTRLDAVASAGFGLSRSRMADLIRRGVVRVDWRPVTSPSRELKPGERVQLEGKGEVRLVSVASTRRDRYRLELERS